MAQPSPIFVTPSTTVVQVNTLQTPYTPVILNGYNYQGQVATILDGTSSFGVLYSSIVVSTNGGTTFLDGSISTLINQPQGFVTAQAQAPNLWAFLNSFPFRNQYLSAGLYNLTTSTFTTATLSSIQQYTNSLNVEELVVSGNFFQSSPITFNTTVSTFGSVDLYSSFSVWQSTFFSSGLSTVGAVRLFSTLTVDGNLLTASSIRALSTIYVSGSVSVIDFVSTGSIQLSSGLVTKGLFITNSSLSSVQTAGSVGISNLARILSSANVGGDFTTTLGTMESLSTFSSFAVTGPLVVLETVNIGDAFSTQGKLTVLGHLSTGDTTIEKNIQCGSNLTVGTNVEIDGFVSTQQLYASTLTVLGDLNVESSNVVTAKTLNLEQNLFLGNLSTLALSVSGVLSTTASASLYSTLTANYFSSLGSVSAISLSTLDNTVVDSFSTFGNVNLFRSAFFAQNLVVLSTSFWNQIPVGPPPIISGDVSIHGNLTLQGTLTLSSIVLPSSVVANNFTVSSLYVGDIAIISSATISSIEASSIGSGGVSKPEFTMDMANALITANFSTTLMSTLWFQAKAIPENVNVANTFFQVTSSLGIGLTASTNTFQVNPLAFTTSNLIAGQFVSSLQVLGGTLTGNLQGNASLMSNTRFPAQLSTSLISVSSIRTRLLEGSSLFLSTLLTDTFLPISTLKIGDLFIYGNVSNVNLGVPLPSFSTPYIMGVNPTAVVVPLPTPPDAFIRSNSNVRLNTLLAMGDNLGFTVGFRGGIVNYDKIPGFETNAIFSQFMSLAIGDTLRVDNLIGQPIFFYSFQGNDLILNGDPNGLNPLFATAFNNLGSTYVSSGIINLSSVNLFVPELTTFVARSTNTIQPVLSTLQFNSTLFARRDLNKVGINTNPFYTLDVKNTIYAATSILMNASSIVQNQITVNQSNLSYWVAAVDPTVSGYPLRYSTDGVSWQDLSGFVAPSFFVISIGTNGGSFSNTSDEGDLPLSFSKAPLWIVCGNDLNLSSNAGVAYYSQDPLSNWSPVTFNITATGIKGPANLYTCVSVSFNGLYWIMTTQSDAAQATLLRSDDGINWSNANSGGFNENLVLGGSPGTGYAAAWNGSLWVAVGNGTTSANSILYSGDGLNWSNSVNGFYLDPMKLESGAFGYDVVWTGKNWVAVGVTNPNMGQPNTGILYSFNGSNWTEPASCPITGEKYSVRWNGSRLVAFSYSNKVFSDDYGLSWNLCIGTNNTNSIFQWNGSYWLATGYNETTFSHVTTESLDGITWTDTAYSGPGLSGLAYSSNAIPSLTIGQSTLQLASTVTTFPGLNVAVGSGTTTLYFSEDGTTWSPALSGAFDTQGRCIAIGNGKWIAGGSNTNSSNLLSSSDGKNWTNISLPDITGKGTFPTVVSVVYGASAQTWVVGIDEAGLDDNTVLFSTDGVSWNPPSNPTVSPIDGTFAIGFGSTNFGGGAEDRFLIAGNPNNLLYSSPDGESWTGESPTGFFSFSSGKQVRGFLYANATWHVVGQSDGATSNIKYSTNGNAWTNASFPQGAFVDANGIAYDGTGLYVAVGYTGVGAFSTIKYSGNGITWSNAVSGEFANTGYAVTYNSELSLWIAVGEDDNLGFTNVKYSADGCNWTSATGDQLTYGYGVAATAGYSATTEVISYYNQVSFLNNPLPAVAARNISPSLTYGPSSFILNNALVFDRYQNLAVNTSNPTVMNLMSTTFSTFYNFDFTNVTETFSTNRLSLFGPFTLGTQYV